MSQTDTHLSNEMNIVIMVKNVPHPDGRNQNPFFLEKLFLFNLFIRRQQQNDTNNNT